MPVNNPQTELYKRGRRHVVPGTSMKYEKIRRRTDLRSQLEIREAVRREFEKMGLPTKGGISMKSREEIEALSEIARRRWRRR